MIRFVRVSVKAALSLQTIWTSLYFNYEIVDTKGRDFNSLYFITIKIILFVKNILIRKLCEYQD